MKQALREPIQKLGLPLPGSHAGLTLHRLLEKQPEGGEKLADRQHPYATLADKIADWSVPKVYEEAFHRWKERVQSQGAVLLEATAIASLAVGLGNASPIENGLSVHHTYGTPYLPGSAVKGLLRRAADKRGLSEADQKILFGDTKSAGHIVFWDGWLEPAKTNDDKNAKPYQKDVITVHHPDYYGKRGEAWPTDFDDPNPVAFLSVRPGTKFCIALSSASSNSEDWVFAAAEILKWGLEKLGLGGKTNAGYGYFICEEAISPEQEARNQAEAQALLEEYLPRIEKIANAGSTNLALKIARELATTRPEIRRPTLERVKQQLEKHDLWNLAKDYVQTIRKLLEE